MTRPFTRYPANRHLVQILERAQVVGAARIGRLTLEASRSTAMNGSARGTGPTATACSTRGPRKNLWFFASGLFEGSLRTASVIWRCGSNARLVPRNSVTEHHSGRFGPCLILRFLDTLWQSESIRWARDITFRERANFRLHPSRKCPTTVPGRSSGASSCHRLMHSAACGSFRLPSVYESASARCADKWGATELRLQTARRLTSAVPTPSTMSLKRWIPAYNCCNGPRSSIGTS